MMLKIDGLTVRYGNIEALHGINLEVNEGEIVTLIGANGAGKTTTLHSVSGIIPKVSGKMRISRSRPGKGVRREARGNGSRASARRTQNVREPDRSG